MRRALLALTTCALLSAGCATTKSQEGARSRDAAAALDLEGSWQPIEGDPRVGRYTSKPWGFHTASYWIEGPDGLIVVDTQFLPSAAAELIEVAEAATGKQVVLAVVLHPNPDKFNGTATFQARGVKVVTSQQVLDAMPAVHAKRLKAFYSRYEPDYPLELPAPEPFGATTTTLTAAGLELTAHVVGAGCSEAHVVLQFEDHVFAGDLIASGVHSWLEIGRPDAWLDRVDEMKALAPRYVHPGRGPSGGPELLDAQASYLKKAIEVVAAEHPSLPVDEDSVARARATLEALYPDYGYNIFLRLGLPAEFERQGHLAEENAR